MKRTIIVRAKAKPANKSVLSILSPSTILAHFCKLQTKIEEIRLVNRAKCCLIQYLKFSEPQAHRYIEKQAMDTRQTRKEVAQRILSTYET